VGQVDDTRYQGMAVTAVLRQHQPVLLTLRARIEPWLPLADLSHPRIVHLFEGSREVFALLALICFILALFGVHLGSIDLVILGLVFVAAHLLLGIGIPWVRRP
jgi:hypothetical protein